MFLRVWPTEKLLYVPIDTHQLDTVTARIHAARSKTRRATQKMTLSQKSLAGPGYIILNCIRVMNIIGLLAVITAGVVMLVKTAASSKFFFFDAVGHVLTAVTGMFLLVSELSLFRSYFARNWPLLSPAHGFVTLALAMIVLGIDMLGNLNKAATSEESLGLAFWRIVIGSGVVIFVLGHINLVASYVFRDRANDVTARQVRAHGAVAVHQSPVASIKDSPSAPVLAQSYLPNPFSPTKSGKPFRILTSERRQSTLPSYHTASPISPAKEAAVSPSSRYSRATACTKKKMFGFGRDRQSVGPTLPVHTQDRPMEISAPMGINPQFAHLVQRPDSALHPSRTGESEAFRWRSAS